MNASKQLRCALCALVPLASCDLAVAPRGRLLETASPPVEASTGAAGSTRAGTRTDASAPPEVGPSPKRGSSAKRGSSPEAGSRAGLRYAGLEGRARNPIVSHIYTADPSAHVFEGRIYVYASHDPDDQQGYDMVDYHVFSTNDLVNWQDHGVALDSADIPWASRLYAPDAAYSEVTGKYYLYFPDGASSIGVAVSDKPGGPFVDALGRPLVDRNTPGGEEVDWVFDPSVFVDDDGQAYLYYGGGLPDTGDNARVIRLAEDRISLADEMATTIVAPDFFEAAFVHKYEGQYYFSYSTTFAQHSATIDYMLGDSPTGQFQFAGTLLPNPRGNNGNNNHHSVVEYEGQWYIFYHNRVLSAREGRSDFQRSITLDRFQHAKDGSIGSISAEGGEIIQLRNLDAFSLLEAETLADQRGVEVGFVEESEAHAGVALTDLNDGDWVGYSQVDFGAGATRLTVRVASGAAAGGEIAVHVDGSTVFSNLRGERLGSCEVPRTGGWQAWTEIECAIERTTGVHDVYLSFVGAGSEALLSLDHFQFE